jgi:hypothetical protein
MWQREHSEGALSYQYRDGVGGKAMREAVFVKFGRFMKSHGAISGAQRGHEPVIGGGCQTAADSDGSLTKAATRFIASAAAILCVPWGNEPAGRNTRFQLVGLESILLTVSEARSWKLRQTAARNDCATPLISGGTKSDGRRVLSLEKNSADDNDTDSCHQAVRVWKALVGMVGGKGGVPLFAARAEARINDNAWIFIDGTLAAEDDSGKAKPGFYLCDLP